MARVISFERIGKGAACAAAGIGLLLAGTTSASAAVQSVSATPCRIDAEFGGRSCGANIYMLIATVSDTSGQVWFSVDGVAVGSSAITTVNASEVGTAGWAHLEWTATTSGRHHIVAEERKADGSVLSSASTDFDVTVTPSSGSADGLMKNLMTGSS